MGRADSEGLRVAKNPAILDRLSRMSCDSGFFGILFPHFSDICKEKFMNQASNQSGRPFQPVLEALESRLAPAVAMFAHQVNNLYVLGLNRLPETAGLN